MNSSAHKAKSPSNRTYRFAALVRLRGGRGSGAPSRRGRLALLVLALAALALLVLAPLSQAKVVVDAFGTTGGAGGAQELGGQFAFPLAIAVNETGAGGVPAGTIYVSDRSAGGNPSRVERLSPTGAFERAWGQNVIAAGAPGDISETAFEICTAAPDCRAAVATGTTANGGQLNGAVGIAVNQENGHVYVAEQSNRRISEFDADGNFIRAWGWDVDGSNPSTGFEICSQAANCQQAAAAGGGAGQFGNELGQPIVDSANNIWVPDPSNNRIQEFDSTGNFIKMVGGDVVSDGAVGTGTLSTTSKTITAVTTTSKVFQVGQTVTSSGGSIPAGTRITAVGPGTITLSQEPTESGSETITAAAGSQNIPTNETQTVTVGGAPTGGTFTLTFTTPDPSSTTATATAIPYNASALELEEKLQNLSNIGAGNVAVTGAAGGPWTVEFKGARFADTDVAQMTAAGGGLTPTGTIAITSANGLEVCSVAASCRAGAVGTAPGQFGATGPGNLAFDSSGNLYAIDPGNKRVEKFDPSLRPASEFGGATFPSYTSSAPEHMVATRNGTRLAFAVINNVSSSTERQVVELDPTDASVQDTSLVGLHIGQLTGLAYYGVTDTLFVSTNPQPYAVLGLGAAVPDPALAVTSIANTDTTATFSGTIDPMGGTVVECSFQYSTDQVSWTTVPVPDCASLDPSGGPQAVSANVTGLIANTHYFVRLSAARPLAPGSTKNSIANAFDTESTPPVSSNIGAIEVADSSARLVGTIDPHNSPTGYVFQYGTTPALGSSTSSIDVGGGKVPLLVSRQIQGLAPNTTYYFRLVATNLAGPGASASQTFTTRATPLPLPDDRAYELVTPADKNFGSADGGKPKATIAANGQAVGFCTDVLFDQNISGAACTDYLSRRDADGWSTVPFYPPTCTIDRDETEIGGVPSQQISELSQNLDVALFFRPESSSCTAFPPLVAAPVSGANLPGLNLYREDFGGDPATYNLLTPARQPGPTPKLFTANGSFGASNPDLSHIVFSSSGAQSAEAPAQSALCLTAGLLCRTDLFEWDHGTIGLLSRDTNNAPFSTSSAIASTAGSDGVNVVSTDGDRVFFQNPTAANGCTATNCELYLREDGARTYWVSEQECSPACSNTTGPDTFQWATPNGDKAFFLSPGKLTNEDTSTTGNDLYMYTQGASPATEPHNLTLLSQDNQPDDGIGAEVLGTIGISNDGDTVYFAAKGQIVAGGPTASGTKIYRWQWNAGSPTIEYLATINAGEVESWNGSHGGGVQPPLGRYVTPNGADLVIWTAKRLVPSADSDDDLDVYRWDEREGWSCVSCQLPGTPSAGESIAEARFGSPASGGLGDSGATVGSQSKFVRYPMSEDGKRIFFNSKDALVPGDTNGLSDVYEWHEGAVHLISSGSGNFSSFLIGADKQGKNVFFYTGQRLVGWDVDANVDIYDARVGGGFPEPPAAGATCEGDACRAAGTSSPAGAAAGTSAFSGSGNSPKLAGCSRGFHKAKVKGRSVCKKTKKAHKRNRGKKDGTRHRRRAHSRYGAGK